MAVYFGSAGIETAELGRVGDFNRNEGDVIQYGPPPPSPASASTNSFALSSSETTTEKPYLGRTREHDSHAFEGMVERRHGRF
ncbi:MAG: hypothetical protein VKK42_09475 [Lyngbya sp.]|nr:hypothetical protein [Lyngbya sp.]